MLIKVNKEWKRTTMIQNTRVAFLCYCLWFRTLIADKRGFGTGAKRLSSPNCDSFNVEGW